MSVMKITNENFEQAVLKADKPVLLDFYADWCGPCRMVGPIIEEIAQEQDGFLVGKINVDQEPVLAAQYKVYTIPTLMVMQGGNVLRQSAGAKSKNQILAMLPK